MEEEVNGKWSGRFPVGAGTPIFLREKELDSAYSAFQIADINAQILQSLNSSIRGAQRLTSREGYRLL